MSGSQLSPAMRFAQFRERPDVMRVTEKYADWACSPNGMMINMQLAALGMMRLTGRVSRQSYRKSVADLAVKAGVPEADFRILAECTVEILRGAKAAGGRAAAQMEGEGNE